MMKLPLGQDASTVKCPKCKGTGHREKLYPNKWTPENERWKTLSAEQKAKPCMKCKGIGHLAFMHKKEDKPIHTQQVKTDCPAWLVGKCSRGNGCHLLHDASRQLKPIDKDCFAWLKGN